MLLHSSHRSLWNALNGLPLFLTLITTCIFAPASLAQEFYRLNAPELKEPSRAAITETRLSIKDAQGTLTHYDREPRLDSSDRQWIGFVSKSARQAIRWPVSNQGKMQIGTIDSYGQYQFRASRMSITEADPRDSGRSSQPLRDRVPVPGGNNNDAFAESILPPNGQDGAVRMDQVLPIRLSLRSQQPQFLSLGQNASLSVLQQVNGQGVDWTMVPVGNGMVRFQMKQGNQWMALGCHPRNRAPMVMPISGAPGQLWKWSAFPGAANGYLLESVLFPGQALSFQGGNLFLQQISFLPSQQWFPIYPDLVSYQPVYRSVRSETLPNPALPPARVELANRHSEAIFVLLADRRAGGMVTTIRIPAGGSEVVMLDRDSGANVIETHEQLNAFGTWESQEYNIPIPPAILYDISVYEEFLQSIAIDRTGKSPNPIEDINYQPKSLGWFVVPPGEAIGAQEIMDVHTLGKNAKNPGAVRKIDRELLEKKKLPSEDPLRSILQQFQSQRAAF